MHYNIFYYVAFLMSEHKTHVVRGMSKHYHLRLDPKLVHGKYAIQLITFEYVSCTNMLDKTLATCVDHTKQPIYQPVVDCTYRTVLGFSNN